MEDQHKSDPNPGDGQEPPTTTIAPENGAPRGDTTADEGANKAGLSKDQIDRDLVRWTRALAFFTGALVLAAGLQFWAMRDQLTEMQNARTDSNASTNTQLAQMQSQTTAMQGQLGQMQAAFAQTERAIATTQQLADAAVQANQISRQSLSGVQRAFIQANGVDFEPVEFKGAEPMWEGNIVLENSGNTPTVDLLMFIQCHQTDNIMDDPTTLPSGERGFPKWGSPSPGIFGPRQPKKIGPCAVNDPLKSDQNLVETYYDYGKAVYRDTFDPNAVHITEFCFFTLSLHGPVFPTLTAKVLESGSSLFGVGRNGPV